MEKKAIVKKLRGYQKSKKKSISEKKALLDSFAIG